jgi:hypothetical protein
MGRRQFRDTKIVPRLGRFLLGKGGSDMLIAVNREPACPKCGYGSFEIRLPEPDVLLTRCMKCHDLRKYTGGRVEDANIEAGKEVRRDGTEA